MNPAFDCKYVSVTPPAAIIDNAAAATATIDTLGYDFLEVLVYFGAMDIAVGTMKIQESDDSGMSGAADVVGTRFGTDANDTGSTSTLPAATDDNKIFAFNLDLRGRKRYLDLSLTLGDGAAGTFVAALARLSRCKDAPRTAAEAGLSQRMVA